MAFEEIRVFSGICRRFACFQGALMSGRHDFGFYRPSVGMVPAPFPGIVDNHSRDCSAHQLRFGRDKNNQLCQQKSEVMQWEQFMVDDNFRV